ncbi:MULTISPECIES: YhdH/YhfP family quinone oxidoreductase [unclassified Paraflavitalea]|uniref:YhdH/YhfP family quinone oxidoreductase n=1 Tax=unclassified Paraflavitalea TaxID=2798305 RepID=UPI003D32D0E0
MKFRALMIQENAGSIPAFVREIKERNLEDLPKGEVLIKVLYSSLNYKDALSASGNKGITKVYPHTPGIDAAGIVELSTHSDFISGDEVIVTGYDLGMNTAGGYGEYIRVPAQWVVHNPNGLSLQDSMVLGTAGITAAIGLFKMRSLGFSPNQGTVVVTGSTGGVGSMAVALLSKLGYAVKAVSGKENAAEYLHFLGAKEIAPRSFVDDSSGKALIKPKWAGAFDTVGGNVLATLLKGCGLEGVVVSTGLVQSPELKTTVFPFILNGVSLLGVGSAETPHETKEQLWQLLAGEWNISDKFQAISKVVSLEELSDIYIDKILRGEIMGRVVVKHAHQS